MVTICSGHGGPTSKPGYARAVITTSAAVEAGLVEATSGVSSVVLAGLIAGVTYDLTTICAADPPADPGITAQDVLDALDYAEPLTQLPAIAKLRQWFLHWYWYQVCQCADGTSPGTAPTLVVPVTTGTDPGLPAGPVATSCFHFDSGPTPFVSFSNPNNAPLYGGVFTTPPGATSLQYAVIVSATDQNITNRTIFFDANGFQLSNLGETLIFAGGSGITVAHAIPVGATQAIYQFGWSGAMSSTARLRYVVDVYCGQIPGQLVTACCPPDPSLSLKVDQIFNLVLSLYQGAPVAVRDFADSTTHAVTGSGTFSTGSGTIALRVTLGPLKNVVGVETGPPDRLFGELWITPEAGGYPYASQRIRHSPQLFVLPTLTDAVAYTLPAGQTASIVELTRGP